MEIRNAGPEDLPELVAIQNAHIANGFKGLFRETPYTLEERRPWFDQFRNSGPHQILVAEDQCSLQGFACSFSYRGGGVFERTVETSIYTDLGSQTRGIGSALYTELIRRLALETTLHLVVVGIALPNDPSISLHRKFGFVEVGTFEEYAFFRGEYVSSLWMQRRLTSQN